MNWDKSRLHALLLQTLRTELQSLLQSAQNAQEGATHEDAIAKSKYDTHGLELSYLAGSQMERARAADTRIVKLESTPFPPFDEDDSIDAGALIGLASPGGVVAFYLLSSIGAGIELEDQGRQVAVLSPESPLGVELLGLGVGDRLENPRSTRRNYEVISIV